MKETKNGKAVKDRMLFKIKLVKSSLEDIEEATIEKDYEMQGKYICDFKYFSDALLEFYYDEVKKRKEEFNEYF